MWNTYKHNVKISILPTYLIFVHGKCFCDIHLLISEQDLLRTNETATQAQMLAHSNDLIRDMHALTEEEELVYCDDAFVRFLAANQSPVTGRLEGMQMPLLTISIS